MKKMKTEQLVQSYRRMCEIDFLKRNLISKVTITFEQIVQFSMFLCSSHDFLGYEALYPTNTNILNLLKVFRPIEICVIMKIQIYFGLKF